MKKIKFLSYAIAALMVTPSSNLLFAAPQGNSTTPSQITMELMRWNAEPLKSTRHHAKGDVWGRLRAGFRMNEVNPELVRKHEQYYASRAQYFNRTLARGSKYLHFITEEVEKRNMPTEIALLPVIESAFVTQAKSHVGASGLWQFMPATGTHYKLEQTWWYDGRRDVHDSTRAALDYLEYLHRMFGDWSLALASYNWGEGSVGRAVKRAQAAGLPPTYENLKMPNETRNYVPKLLAVRNLIANPENFGLRLEPLPSKPYFETVSVGKHMDIALAANFAEISVEEFNALNPAYNLPVYADKPGRKMLLPVDSVSTFHKNMRKWGNKPLLSWDVYTAQGGESLAQLAQDRGMTVSQLKEINGIRGNGIQAGRPILLAKSGTAPVTPSYTAPVAEPAILVAQTGKPAQQNTATITPRQETVVLASNTTKIETPATVKQNDIIIKANTNQSTPAPLTQLAQTQQNKVETNIQVVSVVSTPVVQTETAPAIVATNIDNSTATSTQNTEEDKLQTLLAQKEADERINKQLNEWKKESEAPAKPVVVAEATPAAKGGATYKVQSGDTLYRVAKNHNMNVEELKRLNRMSADTLVAGTVLQVSGKATTTAASKSAGKESMYTVQKGDSWYTISKRVGISHQELIKMNPKNASGLQPGQKIRVRLIDL